MKTWMQFEQVERSVGDVLMKNGLRDHWLEGFVSNVSLALPVVS